MSKTVISNYQLTIFMAGLMFGSGPLLISSGVVSLAGADAWLSVIVAGIAGLLVVWMNSYLGELYPQKTFVEIIRLLLGKWLGSLVAGCFVLVTLIATAQIIWYVGDFFKTMYMPEMSYYQINIMFAVAVAIALLYGLEAMLRATEILFVVFFPLYILSMLMLIPDIKAQNLLPMLENGITPVLKGTNMLFSFVILPTILLNMITVSSVSNKKDYKKSKFKGYMLGIFLVFIAVLMPILITGSTIIANIRFPLYVITKQINLGTMFSRVEVITVFVWLATNFIASFIYFYSGVVGLSHLLKLKDYKKIVLPLMLIVVVYSGFIYKNVPYEIRWDSVVWGPCIFTFGFVLPLVLLIVSFIRKRLISTQLHK